jgi:uncharacterized iron-regulated protein
MSNIAGDRQSAIDHVLAGLAKLQNSVADAADYTPAYDRRQYGEVNFYSIYIILCYQLTLFPS